MPIQLTGGSNAIKLELPGIAIRAPGLRGTATATAPRTPAQRTRSRQIDDGTIDLEQALNNTNMVERAQIDVVLQPATGHVGPVQALRSIDNRQDVLELQTPDPGANYGVIVLACDETGTLTWHLPVDSVGNIQTVRGSSSNILFHIPATIFSLADGTEVQTRSILGTIGRKVLKVLVYPLTDLIFDPLLDIAAAHWERANRPYGVRSFTPQNYKNKNVESLTEQDWQHLSGGRALLFIHGTFSTAHGAFAQFDPQAFDQLYQCYDGRVFAFNHHSLSADPQENIHWLLEQVPSGVQLEVDIICHSRGGLVARMLAERATPGSRIKVNRIALVAVPNNGTLLADAEHMVNMIDRYTTALNLFPTGPITETLEALITTIKILGHAGLNGLPGLSAMRPDGQLLASLNQIAMNRPDYFAVAADFEPTATSLKALITGSLANGVMDRVFGGEANDLVVPEAGVYSLPHHPNFINSNNILRIPSTAGIMHTTIFGHSPTTSQILAWLTLP